MRLYKPLRYTLHDSATVSSPTLSNSLKSLFPAQSKLKFGSTSCFPLMNPNVSICSGVNPLIEVVAKRKDRHESKLVNHIIVTSTTTVLSSNFSGTLSTSSRTNPRARMKESVKQRVLTKVGVRDDLRECVDARFVVERTCCRLEYVF